MPTRWNTTCDTPPAERAEEAGDGIYRLELREIRVYFRISDLDRLVEVIGVAATKPLEGE